jgi:hypothetical protein
MSTKKCSMLMAAFAAMCFLSPVNSFAQKAFSPKIKTPNTSSELSTKDEKKVSVQDAE